MANILDALGDLAEALKKLLLAGKIVPCPRCGKLTMFLVPSVKFFIFWAYADYCPNCGLCKPGFGKR